MNGSCRVLAWVGLFALPACGGGDFFVLDMSPPLDLSLIDGQFVDEGVTDGASDLNAPDAPVFNCQSACDPRLAGGCDEAMCVLYGSQPSCATATGDQAIDQPCDDLPDCAPGTVCVQRQGGSVCRPICCPSDLQACENDERCVGGVVLGDGSTTEWGACEPRRRCDILTGTGCNTLGGSACYIVSSFGDTDCRTAGAGDVGDDCVLQTDCGAGLFCPAGGHCVRICALTGGEPSCPSIEGSCTSWPQSPPGSGLCTP